MNAFVLAGNRGASRPILGGNKSFLPLEGRPLFLYVLMALDRVREVERIYLIGPRRELMRAIESALPETLFSKRIEVLEQKESLLENILYAYSYSLSGYQEGADMRRSPQAETPGLFLPSDIPLATAAEIEEFIAKADMKEYDYCMGVTGEERLAPFYPSAGRPGIKMAYLYLKEKAYRLNNLHLARPFKVGAGGLVQKMYDHRHQKYVGNRLRIAREILQTPRWTRALSLYFLAQGAVFSEEAGLAAGASFFRRFLPIEKVEREASYFLKTRFKAVETTIGGAALDVDDEESYRTVSLFFKEWRSYLAGLGPRAGVAEFCPFKTEACG